jgi:transcriptional regulator with XRE-family HTH domain
LSPADIPETAGIEYMEVAEQLIARQIHQFRERKRLTLQQVAEKAGVSKSFLSKVEHCQVSISIAALSRLANALGVPLGEFFALDGVDSDVVHVPRARYRSMKGRNSYRYDVLVSGPAFHQMEPVIVAIDGRRARFQLREHPGEQLLYMIEGETDYVCGGRSFSLREGDFLYFDARIPHGPRPKKNQKARYLAVSATYKARQRKHTVVAAAS